MSGLRLPLLVLLLSSSCATPRSGIEYEITTQSHYICCRTLRYSTWEFTTTYPSALAGEGVVVELEGPGRPISCDEDLHLGVRIANNGSGDVHIPISYELQGEMLLVYPFRAGWVDGHAVRIARQLQYGDIVDSALPRLRFHRLPHGRELRLTGVVPRKWLCSQPQVVSDEYLEYEGRSSTFYVDRSRSLGTLPYRRDPELRDTLRLRFDVAYSALDFYDAFPVIEQRRNRAGDSVSVRVAVEQQPKELLDGSQHLASSNVVVIPLR